MCFLHASQFWHWWRFSGRTLSYFDQSYFCSNTYLLSNVALTSMVAFKNRTDIHIKDLSFMISGRLLGTIPALFLIATAYFDIVFCAVILFAVILSSIGWRFTINPLSLSCAGMLSGFMGTLSSIGGPPVALLYQHKPTAQFIATLSMQLVIGGMISVIGIWIMVGISADQLLATIILLPGMIAGLLSANRLRGKITSDKIRYAILLLSSVAAVRVLWGALT